MNKTVQFFSAIQSFCSRLSVSMIADRLKHNWVAEKNIDGNWFKETDVQLYHCIPSIQLNFDQTKPEAALRCHSVQSNYQYRYTKMKCSQKVMTGSNIHIGIIFIFGMHQ